MIDHLDTAAFAAAFCALGGLMVPLLIARVPEPRPAPDAASAEEPKEEYVQVAARPHLALRSAVVGALAGAVIGLAVGWEWPLLFLLPLVPVSVALAVIDWHTRLLPSRVVLPAHAATVVLAGVCWLATRDTDAVVRAVIGMVVVRSLFWALWYIRSAGMGFGDVRLSALIGFALGYLGVGELVVGVYSGFLVFALPGLAIAVVRRSRELLRTAYPFGPFMLLGALAGIAFGEQLWSHLVNR